jgi:ribose 5-phosphate isomerase A
MDHDAQIKLMKQQVGLEAARLVEDGAVVGLGTGSTAVYMIEELGRRVRSEGLRIVGIPTSYDAAVRARSQSIPVRTLDDVERIDIAIDGADEVDPMKCLIKGRGAAHTREKIIDSLANIFVVVVDDSKLVDRLGTTCPVPVEVLPMAVAPVMRRLRDLGGTPVLRMGVKKDGPVITDQGNMVVDVTFGGIDDPAGMERTLNNIPGVVENGLFVGVATIILVGQLSADGVVSVRRIE